MATVSLVQSRGEPTVEIDHLSASTNGRPINVTSASTPVTLHTVPTGKRDVVSIYATNNASGVRRLEVTISSGSDTFEAHLMPNQDVVVVHRLVLDAGETIECTLDGSSAGDVNVHGEVERRDA